MLLDSRGYFFSDYHDLAIVTVVTYHWPTTVFLKCLCRGEFSSSARAETWLNTCCTDELVAWTFLSKFETTKRCNNKWMEVCEYMQWRRNPLYLSCIYFHFLISNDELLRQAAFLPVLQRAFFEDGRRCRVTYKFMNLVHFPCSLMLEHFWFPFLVLSLQTVTIWWNDLAAILHNTSSKTKWANFLVTSWSAHTMIPHWLRRLPAVGNTQYLTERQKLWKQ